MDFGGLGNIMQQAQKMQSEMKAAQEALAKQTVEGSAGGGMVKVVANGKSEVISVTLDPEVVKMGDVEMLQDLVTAGVNDALNNAKEMAAKEMKDKLAGNLGPLGPLMNFLS